MIYLLGCNSNKHPMILILILVSTHMYKIQATEAPKVKPPEEVKLWNTTNVHKNKTVFTTRELGYEESLGNVRRSIPYEVQNKNDEEIQIENINDEDYTSLYSDNSTSKENENTENDMLSFCLFSISLICMIFHMATFFIIPGKRNVPSMNLFCVTLSLFIAEFLYFTFLSTENYIGCYATEMIMYFTFTAALFWMNVMSFDINKTFSSKQFRINSKKTFIIYSIYAWGSATLLSLLVLTVDRTLPEDSNSKLDIGKHFCWFHGSNLKSMIIFFILPSSGIIICNLIIYIKTVFVIYKQFQDVKFATSPPTTSTSSTEISYKSNGSLSISNSTNTNGNRLTKKSSAELQKYRRSHWRQFMIFSKLAVIMGFSWIFGILFAITGYAIVGQIFKITTSLQGTFIFIIFLESMECYKQLMNWRIDCFSS